MILLFSSPQQPWTHQSSKQDINASYRAADSPTPEAAESPTMSTTQYMHCMCACVCICMCVPLSSFFLSAQGSKNNAQLQTRPCSVCNRRERKRHSNKSKSGKKERKRERESERVRDNGQDCELRRQTAAAAAAVAMAKTATSRRESLNAKIMARKKLPLMPGWIGKLLITNFFKLYFFVFSLPGKSDLPKPKPFSLSLSLSQSSKFSFLAKYFSQNG